MMQQPSGDLKIVSCVINNVDVTLMINQEACFINKPIGLQTAV